jgi:hypothetical protein
MGTLAISPTVMALEAATRGPTPRIATVHVYLTTNPPQAKACLVFAHATVAR